MPPDILKMGAEVKNIKVDDLQPGMITALEVLTQSGHLLLPSGTKLTSRYIRMLHARDIDYVAVESAESGQRPVRGYHTSAAPADEQTRRVDTRFKHNDASHPFIKELARVCKSRLSNRE